MLGTHLILDPEFLSVKLDRSISKLSDKQHNQDDGADNGQEKSV